VFLSWKSFLISCIVIPAQAGIHDSLTIGKEYLDIDFLDKPFNRVLIRL
jgi:hypothetical protein